MSEYVIHYSKATSLLCSIEGVKSITMHYLNSSDRTLTGIIEVEIENDKQVFNFPTGEMFDGRIDLDIVNNWIWIIRERVKLINAYKMVKADLVKMSNSHSIKIVDNE